MAGDPSPESCVVLTLGEAWKIRMTLRTIERRNGTFSFDQGVHDSLSIMEKSMGFPPKRDLLTAIQWDRERPGQDFDPEELQWRQQVRMAFERWDPLEGK